MGRIYTNCPAVNAALQQVTTKYQYRNITREEREMADKFDASKDFMFGNIARNALAEIERLDALVLKLQTRADYMDARYNDLVNFRKKHG